MDIAGFPDNIWRQGFPDDIWRSIRPICVILAKHVPLGFNLMENINPIIDGKLVWCENNNFVTTHTNVKIQTSTPS